MTDTTPVAWAGINNIASKTANNEEKGHVVRVQQLMEQLGRSDPNAEVMILDGHNSGGAPREINMGPTVRVISQADADDGADCEGKVGKSVVVMGYGCY